jgi:hypothetical protein
MPIALSHSPFPVQFRHAFRISAHPYRNINSKSQSSLCHPDRSEADGHAVHLSALPDPPLQTQHPNKIVMPTEAQRSGGTCCFTLGRNESRECNEPFPICPFPIGLMDIFPNLFPSISPMQLKEPPSTLSSRPKRSGAGGSAVPLPDATNLANATNHFPFAPNHWDRLILVSEFEWKKQNPPLAEG